MNWQTSAVVPAVLMRSLHLGMLSCVSHSVMLLLIASHGRLKALLKVTGCCLQSVPCAAAGLSMAESSQTVTWPMLG